MFRKEKNKMDKYEKIKLVAQMQQSYKDAVKNNKLTKKTMCEICVPVRDALALSDLETLKMAREEMSLMDIINMIDNTEKDVCEMMILSSFMNDERVLITLKNPAFVKIVNKAEAQYLNKSGKPLYAIVDGQETWFEEVCLSDAITHMDMGGLCGIKLDKTIDFMTQAEQDVLTKIAKLSGMDNWFSVISEHGRCKIYDMEEDNLMNINQGLSMFGEGFAKLDSYNLSKTERSTLFALFARFELLDILEDVK